MNRSARSRLAVSVAPLLLWAACERCESGPGVPFKLPGKGAADASQSGGTAQTPEARTYPTPTDRPPLDGQPLPLTGVRATLLVDLDADEDRDAIALTVDATGNLHFSVALREPTHFEAPHEFHVLGDQSEGATCQVTRAELSRLSPSKAVAFVDRGCGTPPQEEPPSQTVFSLEATPRVYERFAIRTEAPDAPRAQLSLSSADVDADGHDDVVLEVRLAHLQAPGDALRLAWFDRPSGLVRDLREPENTFSAWVAAADALLAKAPEQAAARAQAVLEARELLCREAGAPLLLVSDNAGLPCGRGKSRAQALLVLLQAQATQKRLPEAFDAYRTLVGTEPALDPRTLDKVASALSSLPARAGVALRRGPRVEPASAPAVQLPPARFVSEDSLYVQRPDAVLYDLEASQESPVPMPADGLMRDPSGQLAVTAIERGCGGYTLRVERAPSMGAPYVATRPVSTPLLLPQVSTPDCTGTRTDLGGFLLLGWAPQGVVAARGSALYVVPLSLDGKPAGEPRKLESSTPCPAPLPAGAATPDGLHYAEATPFGVLVYGPPTAPVELWRPDGYASIGKIARAAAISPSGKRVALVAGENVYVLERTQ